MAMGISEQDIEMRFQKAKFDREQQIWLEIQDIEARQEVKVEKTSRSSSNHKLWSSYSVFIEFLPIG